MDVHLRYQGIQLVDEGRGINGFELNVDNRSLGEGCQPDGITVYGGRVGRGIFPIVTRGRVINPNQNWNSLANRVQAFHTFLDYCREYDLKVEFRDVHFSQGSFKQLETNEKNKSKKYSDAFRTFIQREDDESAHARGNMRYLNSSRHGAPLVSSLQIFHIQRTIVDAVALPLKSGIAMFG